MSLSYIVKSWLKWKISLVGFLLFENVLIVFVIFAVCYTGSFTQKDFEVLSNSKSPDKPGKEQIGKPINDGDCV